MKEIKPARKLFSSSRGKNLLPILVAVIFFSTGILQVNASTGIQQRRISGVVTDPRGLPLPGVNVVVAGTTQGTLTDTEGKYSLEVNQDSRSLVFTFIGMVTQEVVIGTQTRIDVTLVESAVGLDEIVVVGYGTQKKVSMVNAVSNISSKELTQRISSNVNQALQGKLPGLTIIDNGGAPGSESLTLRIRGVTSLNSNEPLVLIDGIPGNLARINPVDIESVSVLKDAASTAIYGTRAAAGVILVTTKAPERGKLSVTYDGYYGIARSNNKPVHMGAVDYMKQQNVAYTNTYGIQYYTDEYIENWPENHASDPEMYPLPNTWVDAMYKPAPQQSHTLTLSGGTESVSSRVSFRYLNEDGIMPNFNFELGEIRANTNFRVNKKLNLNANINVRNSANQQPYNTWGSWYQLNYRIYQNSQWGVPVYDDGSYGLSVDSYSPLILAKEAGLTTVSSTYLAGIFRGEYEIIDGLKLSAQYSTQYNYGYSNTFANKYRFVDKLYPTRVTFANMNSMTDARSLGIENEIQSQLTFNRKFGNHSVSGILGYSQTYYEESNVGGYRQGFYNNDLQTLSLGLNDATKNSYGGNSEWGLRSYFARVNYDYYGKYLFEANARYDGSSRFAEGNRYGFFPSFSLGWRVSNEDFWGSIKNLVNEFKVRASWGQVGSQAVGLYTFIETYNQSNYIFNEALATGYRQTSLASQDLSWETTTQLNVGLDASFFESKVNLTADYYVKTTDDILLAVPIPSLIGLTATNQNAGSVENRGFELMVGGRETFGGLELGLSIIANYNKNKVLDLAGTGPHISTAGNSDWRTITKEGYPINSFYGLATDGFFQTQAEVDAYAKWDGSVGPGDVKYVDQNNDGQLTPDDFIIFGKEIPDWTFSSNMFVAWKGLRLDLFWQAVAGSEKLITGATLEHGIWGGFTHEVFLDYWTPENKDAIFPRPTKYTMKNVQISERTMVDGSYLRLKNIRLSYDIPESICERIRIQGVNIYLSATNLLTFAELNMYDIDPEQVGRGPESSYPQTSVTTLGMNINF
ncbi:MAG: SusC/RagA family TonB-linked outer membrane protein [Bacteroidales bacterium]